MEIKILVVDDEIDFLETTVKRLKKKQLDAVGVSSGEDALLKIKEKYFDVILLDVKMPGISLKSPESSRTKLSASERFTSIGDDKSIIVEGFSLLKSGIFSIRVLFWSTARFLDRSSRAFLYAPSVANHICRLSS